MIESRVVRGQRFRLASPDGAIIGDIDIPDYVASQLQCRDEVLFRLAALPQVPELAACEQAEPHHRYARLRRSPVAADALELSGATLDELREVVRQGVPHARPPAPHHGWTVPLGFWLGRARPASGGGTVLKA